MKEEKEELYEKAFKCISDSGKTDNDILDRIKIYETQYDFLECQQPVNVIPQDERESHPLLTLDQIAELKTKDHSNIYDFLESETTFQELIKYTIDVKSKQNQVFENLKKAIEGEKDVIEQIKALSRKRVVAIIGKNYELKSGVFTYLWLTHPYNGNNPANWLLFKTPIRQYFCSLVGKYIPNRIHFVNRNCNGLDVKEAKEALYYVQHELENCSKQSKNVRLQGFGLRSSALQSFELKKMAFLRDINCNAHIEALNMMVGMIKDGLLPKEDVIISTETLSVEFEDQFEPIYLEPEKQGRIENITQEKPESEKQAKDNVFRWCSGTWEIIYDGKTIRPTDSYGLRYIHQLLTIPYKEIHVSELVKVILETQGKRSLLEKGKKVAIEDELNESTSDDSIDATALKQYKERLIELGNDIKRLKDSGSELELKELQKESDQISTHLKAATGKKGRPRKLLNQEENYRQAVKNCINDALTEIKKKHSSLYNHFKTEQTIRLGVACSYMPKKEIPWITK